jgi:predicted nucleic acid-binding Zn ribbon protein
MGGHVPFYEYRRPDGTILEVMQKMSDPPLTEDPETGVPLQRVFHPIAVHFKGKGFYNTDYGTKNRQREKAAEEGATSSSEDGAGAKSDASSADTSSSESSSSTDGKPSAETAAKASPPAKKPDQAKPAAKR